MGRSDEKCSLMTEEEARTLLREFMERPDKGKEWPKVWIGDVICADELGYTFQATLYMPGWKPEDGWQHWSVDASRRTCGLDIM